jgi:hypothetical protein
VKRRIFLKGVSGAALAAPFLSSLEHKAGAQEVKAPQRLVIYYTNNGCLVNRWFPSVEDGAVDAASLAGKTLEGLAPYASKLLFPRGYGMFPKGQINGYFDPHDQGMGSKLTCAPIDPEGSHYATGRSLDHVVAELVNQGSNKSPLVLSTGFASDNVKQVLSYSAANTPYVAETSTSNVLGGLTGLFGTAAAAPAADASPTEADYRVLRGNSIIDLVREDLLSFQALNMGTADKQRTQDWLDLLRDTEQRVVGSASCNADAATALGLDVDSATTSTGGGGGGFGGGGFGGGGGGDQATNGDTMLNLIALTAMCDANRSIIMQWPGFVTFNWEGITHDYDHHGLSHRNGSAAVGGTCVTGVLDMLNEIDQWYAGRYVKLVALLDSIQEGDSTMLDNTATMWLPELADGNAHNNNNLPIVIAGGLGGYLKQGVSVNVAGDTLGTGDSEGSCSNGNTEVGFGGGSRGGEVPLNKLYTTLLNGVGATAAGGGPIESFGEWDNNSGGIDDPGESTELKA